VDIRGLFHGLEGENAASIAKEIKPISSECVPKQKNHGNLQFLLEFWSK